MRFPKGLCPVLLVMVSGTVAIAIAGPGVAGPAQTPSQGPRPIASLSPAERNQLPDGTQVTLPSGDIVTLGVLRAQHNAHMHAFTAAAGLGRAIAEKLSRQTPASGQAAGNLNSSPATSGPSRAGTTLLAIERVPFEPPSGRVPKDYLDFCNAAQPTVCLYFPADMSCGLFSSSESLICGDWMITDAAVCGYNGGTHYSGWGGYCMFAYPLSQRKQFMPTGPAAAVASCDVGHYKLDQEGAVEAVAPDNYQYGWFKLPDSPQSCVVQVRLSRTR
jgi:hypothetical protein